MVGGKEKIEMVGGGERRRDNEHICRSLIIIIRLERGGSGVDVHCLPFSFR